MMTSTGGVGGVGGRGLRAAAGARVTSEEGSSWKFFKGGRSNDETLEENPIRSTGKPTENREEAPSPG